MLQDIHPDELKTAVLSLITKPDHKNAFFPRVGQIRAEVARLRMLTSGLPDAPTAWGEVVRALRANSWDALPDTITAAIQAIGGRDTIRMASNGEMMSHRARFADAYGNLLQRKQEANMMIDDVKKGLTAGQQEVQFSIASVAESLMMGTKGRRPTFKSED